MGFGNQTFPKPFGVFLYIIKLLSQKKVVLVIFIIKSINYEKNY